MALDCTKITDKQSTWLKTGSRGDQVKEAQIILKRLGYYTKVNGKELQTDSKYEKYTKAAVVAFQKAMKQSTHNGNIGPVTCKNLNQEFSKRNATTSTVVGIDCTDVWLEYGKTNDEGQVMIVQQHLKTLGYYTKSSNGTELKVDGTYGEWTKKAVQAFQRATGHDDDGIFGPATCPDLNKMIGAGSTLIGKAISKTTITGNSKAKKKDPYEIDPKKYNFLPSNVKHNLEIEGIRFVSRSVETTRRGGAGDWQFQEMLGDKGYVYRGHAQPIEHDITIDIRYEDWTKIVTAMYLMTYKVCEVKGHALNNGKYVVNYNINPGSGNSGNWWVLTLHLIRYHEQ